MFCVINEGISPYMGYVLKEIHIWIEHLCGISYLLIWVYNRRFEVLKFQEGLLSNDPLRKTITIIELFVQIDLFQE